MSFYARLRQKYGKGQTNRDLYRKLNYVHQHAFPRFRERLAELRKQKAVTKSYVIVGAGFAGLYTAWLLKEMGADHITVLEASDIVGGRVHSREDFAEGRVIEFGAEFVGACHKTWVKLAKCFGLSLNPILSEEFFSSMELDSKIVIGDTEITGDKLETILYEIDRVYQLFSKEADKVTNPEAPWLDKELYELDKISIGEKLDEWQKEQIINLSENAKKVLAFEMENDNVASIYDQSYLGLLCQIKGGAKALDMKTTEYWDNVENYRCAQGNQALADKMYESLTDKRVHLNKLVTKINFTDEKVKITTKQDEKPYEADVVILCVPPTVFKDIEFTPKRDLEPFMPGMGPAMKAFNSLDSKVWLENDLSPNNFNFELGQLWESTEGQSIGKHSKMVLSVFVGGSHVDKVFKKDEKEMIEYVRSQVKKTLGKDDIKFNSTEFSLHHTKEFVHTGYSYGKKGKVVSTGLLLNTSHYHKRLYFAGEACSSDFGGFMEGALVSAQRAVDRIVEDTKFIDNNKLDHTNLEFAIKTEKGYLSFDAKGWCTKTTERKNAAAFLIKKATNSEFYYFQVSQGPYLNYYLSADWTLGVGVFKEWKDCAYFQLEGKKLICKSFKCIDHTLSFREENQYFYCFNDYPPCEVEIRPYNLHVMGCLLHDN